MPHSNRKVFFIGFNKIGTLSFHKFFEDNGYKSFHNKDDNRPKKRPLAKIIDQNFYNKKPILESIDHADIYSDLHYVSSKKVYEGSFFFSEIYKDYPNSYFILQTRPTNDWLKSRINHNKLLERHAKLQGLSHNEQIRMWKETKDDLEETIKNFFKNKNNFLVYDLSKNKIQDLAKFLHADYLLDCKFYKHYNKSTPNKDNF